MPEQVQEERGLPPPVPPNPPKDEPHDLAWFIARAEEFSHALRSTTVPVPDPIAGVAFRLWMQENHPNDPAMKVLTKAFGGYREALAEMGVHLPPSEEELKGGLDRLAKGPAAEPQVPLKDVLVDLHTIVPDPSHVPVQHGEGIACGGCDLSFASPDIERPCVKRGP